MKILIVEDELELQNSMKEYLENQGYSCETASDFNQAVFKIISYSYECILLDLTLPFGNGLTLIKKIKEIKSKSGIIILSAKNALEDRITGLELGADDYLPKPFHLSELNARLNALLRRRTSNGEQCLQFREITLNYELKLVTVHDLEVDLTDKEYKLLEYFIINQRLVLTKSAIAEHGWGDEFDQADNYDFIYTHIKNLRRKLLAVRCDDYIKTVYGIGYRFTST